MTLFPAARSYAQISSTNTTDMVAFTSGSFVVSEGEGGVYDASQGESYLGVNLTLTRFGNLEGTLLVDLVLTNGTATNGVNYVVPGSTNSVSTNTLTLEPYRSSISFLVGIIDDTVTNANRNFKARLENLRVAGPVVDPPLVRPQLGTTTNATVTILDDDEGVNIERATFRISETGPEIVIGLILKVGGTNGLDIEVDYTTVDTNFATQAGSDYATADADFPTTQGTVIFAAGDTRQTVTIPITDDDLLEFNEDFQLHLTAIRADIDQTNTVVVTNFVQDPNDPTVTNTVVETNEVVTTVPYTKLGKVTNSTITIINKSGSGMEQPAGAVSVTWNTNSLSNPTPGANRTVYDIVLQQDGKAIVAGDFTAVNAVVRNRIARLETNGMVDVTFNPGNGADDFVHAVALTPGAAGQSIIIGGGFTSFNGTPRSRVARLNPNGSLDASFNPGSGANGPVYAVAVDGAGRILVAGDFTTFNGTPRARIARLLPNGNLDNTFNPRAGADNTVWTIALQEDGRILLGGDFLFFDGVYKGGIVRLTSAGLVDASFDTGAGPDGTVYDILVVPSLTLDISANSPPESSHTNVIATPSDRGTLSLNYDFQTETNSLRIYFDQALLLDTNLTATGVVALAYGPGAIRDLTIVVNEGVTNSNVWSYDGVIVPQRSDIGKILIGGSFTSVDVKPRNRYARLNLDGSLDAEFNPPFGADNIVRSLALQPDGSVLLGGAFTRVDGARRSGVARLYSNGSVDTSFMDTAFNQFAGVSDTNGFVTTVALQPNGNVLIGGRFSKVGGGPTRLDVAVRYNIAELIGGSSPGPGTMEFALPSFSYDEYAPSAVVFVTRTNGSLGDIIAIVTPFEGLATPDVDYAPQTNIVIYPDGATNSVPIPFALLDDSEVEGNENFHLLLHDLLGGILLGGEMIPTQPAIGLYRAVVNIVDDDALPGVLGFSQEMYFVNENETNKVAIITVTRTNGAVGAVTVDYAVRNGPSPFGATNNLDFRAKTGTLSFAPGQTNRTFTVDLLDDSEVEQDEIVSLALLNPRGAPIGLGTASLTIIDNDFAPGRISFTSTNYTVIEDGLRATLELRRTGGSLGVITAQYSTADGTAQVPFDYNESFGTLVWNNGDTSSKTIQVPINIDGVVEGAKFLTVQLSNVSPAGALGAISSAVVTIQDDDFYGDFTFSSTNFWGDENGGSAIVTVNRRGGSAESTSVNFSTVAGGTADVSEYTAVSGTLFFGPGETSKSFAVPVTDDAVVDGNKTILLALSSPVLGGLGAVTNASITILDNEAANTPAGSLDTAFRVAGGANNVVYSLEVQPDGKLVVAGEFTDFNQEVRDRIVRLGSDGQLDRSFGEGLTINGPVRATVLQEGGKVVVGGSFTAINGNIQNRIARLNGDGTLDTTFNIGAGADSTVNALAETSVDGSPRILVGGGFNSLNGVTRRNIARLRNDGTVDLTFDPGAGPNGAVHVALGLRDGKVLIGGDFTLVNGLPRNYIARLNRDGSLDLSFDPGGGTDGPVRAIAVQSDDKAVIGGLFKNLSGVPVNYIARLFTDGTFDSTFAPTGAADGPIFALAVQPDGRLIVGGDFTSFNGVPQNRIVRLNADGSLDTTINFGLGANGLIDAIALQEDRKIILAGNFTLFDGVTQNRIARVHGGSTAGAGAFELVQANTFINERVTNAVIVVRRTGGTTGAATVDFAAIQGTAEAFVDFQEVTGPLEFASGQTFREISVPLLDDVLPEGEETILLSLTNPTGGAVLGRQPIGTIVLLSDDSVISFSEPSYSVNESVAGQRATITVRRVGESQGLVSVRYSTSGGTATAGSDYVPLSTTNTLVFASGQTNQTFSVDILNDSTVEENETIGLRLTNPTGGGVLGLASATLTINDDDFAPGVLNLEASPSATEGARSLTVTVNRTSGRSGVVSVRYATANASAQSGVDYESATGILTFADGEISKSFLVTIIDDTAIEGNEALTISLSNPTGGAILGGTSTAVATIIDDDFGPGSLDQSFDTGSGTDGEVLRLVLQQEGKILLSGDFQYVDGFYSSRVARLLPNGSFDPSFSSGLDIGGPVYGLDAQPDGKVVFGGDFTPTASGPPLPYVGRLTTNGFFDATMNSPAGLNGPVFALAVQTNRQIVVGGAFTTPAGYIARINENGTVDVSFNVEGGANNEVYAVALQPDGKVLIGGLFTRVGAVPRNAIARLQRDGLLDPTFAPPSGANGPVYAIAVQSDGKILIGGNFTTVNGSSRNRIARLNSDGSLDLSFNPGAGANSAVLAIAVQWDGKIYLGGTFTSVAGQTRNRVTRLAVDGTLDASFDPGLGPDGAVNALIAQLDGKLVIGGGFTSVNGFYRPGIARLNGDELPPVTEVRIQSIQRLGDGSISLTVGTQAGRNYVIETSDDLVAWAVLETRFATASSIEVRDNTATGKNWRFYRVRLVTP